MSVVTNFRRSMKDDLIAMVDAYERICRDAAGGDWDSDEVVEPARLSQLFLHSAELCAITLGCLRHGSLLQDTLMRAFAEACERVAEQCNRGGDDIQLRACAAQAQSCAIASRQWGQALATASRHRAWRSAP